MIELPATEAKTAAARFGVTEHPRWHDGALWFAEVWAVPGDAPASPGQPEEVARIQHRAEGFG